MSKRTASRQMFDIDFAALSVHVDACLCELIDRGYSQRTIDWYGDALNHFSRWATRVRRPLNGEAELVRRFLSSHPHVCSRSTLSAALHHLLRYLRARGGARELHIRSSER